MVINTISGISRWVLWIVVLFPSLMAAQGKVPVINGPAAQDPSLLWDLKALSVPPSGQWLTREGPVHSLLYESVDYEEKPTAVFAYYSNPDLLNGRTSETKFPAVVLVHGGGGKAFREWVEKWAAEGYAAIAMDLSGKDAGGVRLTNGGADQADTNKFAKIETSPLKDVWTYHAVSSVILAHSWLLDQKEVDTDRTFLTGISWGGYLTSITGALDNRFKGAAPVYGCGFYDESDVFGSPLKNLSAVGKEKWMQHFDPSSYLPMARIPFLWLNGNKDRFYNVVPYAKTYELVTPSLRTVCIKPDMLHSHVHGWEPGEIRVFFDHIAFSQAPLPVIGPVTTGPAALSAAYHSPVTVAQAEFHYSRDTTASNEKREWSKIPVTIDRESKKLSCPVPEGGFAYGFFYLKDHRGMGASSAFIINP